MAVKEQVPMTATNMECGVGSTANAEDEFIQKRSVKEVGPQEVINLSLYDQADPNNLYITTIDKDTFLKL